MKSLFTSLFVFILIAGSWGGAYVFLFQNQIKIRQDLLKKIQDKKCVLNQVNQIIQESRQEKYRQMLAKHEELLEKQVPKTEEASSLIELLNQISTESKMVLHNFEAGESKQKDTWFELPIHITLTGSFPDLMNFLKKLSNLQRLILVPDLSYQDGQAKLTLLTYYGNAEQKAGAITQTALVCGDKLLKIDFSGFPGQAARNDWPTLTRNPFLHYRNAANAPILHLVGVLAQGSSWTALLEDDGGTIGQDVQVGDTTRGGYKVTSISKDKVILSKNGVTQKLDWSN